jgi:hypothetical protein
MKKALFMITVLLCAALLIVGCASEQPTTQAPVDESVWKIVQGEDGLNIIHYTGSVKAVRIPDRINGMPVTSIGGVAFFGTQVTSVTIPNSVTSIGAGAFMNTPLTSVTIGNSVTTIGASAFADTQLTSVTIPNSVTSIGASAFAWTQLTSVTIPNSVTSIGDRAFASTQLTSVTIPDSVTSIGAYAFAWAPLTSVTFGGSETSFSYDYDESFPSAASLYAAYAEGGARTYVRNRNTWTKQKQSGTTNDA